MQAQTKEKKELLPKSFLRLLSDALKRATPFGSIEIFVVGGKITQITTKNIIKTKDKGN